MNDNEVVYLTKNKIDEIEKLKTTSDVIDYMEGGMPNEKKQLVMKQYSKELAIHQWQVIVAEKY